MSADPDQTKAPSAFPDTRWSLVSGVREGRADAGDIERAERALSELCQLYWFPLYVFVRRRGYSAHDAEDLTQGFLVRLIERGDFGSADREKGRLRSYLLGAMKNYLSERHKYETAQKRGGKAQTISIDGAEAEERYALEPREEETPETQFEKRWALTVLENILGRLRAEYESSGKSEQFEALQPMLAWGGQEGGHADAAAKLGISENNVRVSLHRLRKRYGELMREEIADTVAAEGEVDEELNYLMSVLRSP
jgi:RNA polymerase sigma-70 factor (ECF subfamily)